MPISDPNRERSDTWAEGYAPEPIATELSSQRTPIISGVRTATVLLVVDDDDDNREMTQEYLERAGYRTLAAATGSAALEAVASGVVGAMLLDVMMPDMSGRDVLLAIRQRHSTDDLPIIMTTALGTAADIVDYLGLGANDYVVKPLELAVLEARVAKCLQRKQQSQALNDLLEALTGVESRIADVVSGTPTATLNSYAHWTYALAHELHITLGAPQVGVWLTNADDSRHGLGQLPRPGDEVWSRPLNEEAVRDNQVLYFGIVGRLDRLLGVAAVAGNAGLLDREHERALARFGRRLGHIVEAGQRPSLQPVESVSGRERVGPSRVLVCSKCRRCYPEETSQCENDGSFLYPFRPRVAYRLSDRYRLVQKAGQGSMGDVFQARDEVLDRDVAIKILKSELANDIALRQRFEIEAKASAALRDPAIVPVFDFVHDDDHLFIVMEWLEGVDLAQLLFEQGPGSPIQVAELLWQAGQALECAHSAGFVHRDVKPANLFIQTEAQSLRTRLLDFGVAKMTSYDKSSLTRPGGLIGTPQYMAPEQLSSGVIDARSDLFSLALVGLEALTGRSLRRHDSLQEVMSCTSADWMGSLRLLNSGSSYLDRHFAKALHWSSKERPDSALRWAEEAYSLIVRLPERAGWVIEAGESKRRLRPTGSTDATA